MRLLRGGRAALCLNGSAANGAGTLLSGARSITCDDGSTVNHHCGVCAFSEYSVISRRSIVKIRKDIPLVEAALFGCAVMTGVGTVMNTCEVRPGQSVAVIGLGGVGLAALLGALASGASRVLAIDINEAKLEAARGMGATDTFLASDPEIVAKVRTATNGGVDHAVEMGGVAKAFELAYAITRRGGTTATAGLPPPTRSSASRRFRWWRRSARHQGRLHGLLRALAGHPALHRHVHGGACCRWTSCCPRRGRSTASTRPSTGSTGARSSATSSRWGTEA